MDSPGRVRGGMSAGVGRRAAGFTLIEVLVVLAVIGSLLGLLAMGVSRVQSDEEDRAAIETFQLALLDAAGAASARGASVTIHWLGDELVVREGADVVRRWSFPADTQTTLEAGALVTFNASGRIERLADLPDPLSFTWRGENRTLAVSLVGQSQVTP